MSAYLKYGILFPILLLSNLIAAQTDYNDSSNWAVLPGTYSAGLSQYVLEEPIVGIDVFYVYPTLLLGEDDKRWNMNLDDDKHRASVLNSAVQFQASAWANAGQLYVPYYRQAHIRSYYNLENGGRDALLLAYSDIKAAFQYYLDNHNKGKGIILAGHSQGSTHLSLLMKDFFDGTELQKQLVAAYLPGIGLNENEFNSLKLLKDSTSIGGFVTWNTFKRKFDENQYKWYKGKAVVNPVTWDTTLVANRSQHKGFLFSNGKLYDKSFSTHLGNGVIWISTPHFPYRYLAFTMRNYHMGDVNLFWEDIRLNARKRAVVYLENKQ
jgi:hypothetical protein